MVLLNENFLVLVACFFSGLLRWWRSGRLLVLRPLRKGTRYCYNLRAVYHVG